MAVSLSHLSSAERHAHRVAEVLATAPTWTLVIVEEEPVWVIPSACGNGSYQVDQYGCTCRDAELKLERGDQTPCKHRAALFAYLARQPIVDPFKLSEPEREAIASPNACPACGRTELRGDCWRCYQGIRGYRLGR